MMIHMNLPYPCAHDALRSAALKAGVTFERWTQEGSRSHAYKFDVILSGSSSHTSRFGRGYKAATWDEWGIFIESVFLADPPAVVGPYTDHEHFRWMTGARFDDLAWAEQHGQHKWEYGGTSAAGTYSTSECACGAIKRRLLNGVKWADFTANVLT